MKMGMIGLGRMGGNLVRKLQRSGHECVVFDENPLENIRNTNTIRFVMKNGRLYEGDTLNETWPRQRTLDGIYWWNDSPHTEAGIRR